MTNAPSSSGEHLLELTDLACNGLLSSEGYIQLDELLSGNRAHQKVYLEYVYLHSNLAEIANADRPTKVLTLDTKPGLYSRYLTVAIVTMPLLALLAFAALFALQSEVWNKTTVFANSQRIAAVRRVSNGATWTIDETDQRMAVDEQQEINLTDGKLELILRNGTRVVADSPARFRMNNDLSLQLTSGLIRATVPKGISGFTVTTDSLVVEDLGTEFYVEAKSAESLTYVSSGSCRVMNSGADGKDLSERTVNEGYCVLSDALLNLVALDAEQSLAVCETMIARILEFDSTIQSRSASVCLTNADGKTVDANFCSTNRLIYVIPERKRISLSEDLVLSDGTQAHSMKVIPAGTLVDSYLVHYAFGSPLPSDRSPGISPEVQCAGTVTFSGSVAAVLSAEDDLRRTDVLFATCRFSSPQRRVLEANDRVEINATDERTVEMSFHCREGDYDQARIIVMSPPGE